MSVAVGWYRLPRSGQPFHGTIPPGATQLVEAPTNDVPSRPAKSALKEEWVTFAIALGWSREDAEAVSKERLVEELGSVELVQQVVDGGQGETPGRADDAGGDLPSEAAQVVDGPAVGPGADDLADGRDGIAGHEGGG